MSHAHELRQSTSSHEPEPLHVSVQRPAPHLTVVHDSEPVHCTVHDAACSQSISLHVFGPHEIAQFQPAGHDVLLLVGFVITHDFCARSHDEQTIGQLGFGMFVTTTQ